MDSPDCCCSQNQSGSSKNLLRLNVIHTNVRYGSTVPLQNSLLSSIGYPGQCRCTQFFLGHPQTFDVQHFSVSDKANAKEYCDRYSHTFYIHCPLIAFANLSKPYIVSKSIQTVKKEINEIKSLPGACVLHIGKVGTIEQAAQAINDIQVPRGEHPLMPRTLLMESAAGQGTELGRSWDELRHLFEAIDYNTVGLCIDTQHIFASGMSKLDDHESIVKLFDAADSVCPSGISMIHLNDSERSFGSRVDRHENLCQGYIWGKSDSGLKALFARAFEEKIDLILETKNQKEDLIQISQKYLPK